MDRNFKTSDIVTNVAQPNNAGGNNQPGRKSGGRRSGRMIVRMIMRMMMIRVVEVEAQDQLPQLVLWVEVGLV